MARKTSPATRPPVLEWITAAVGAVVVLVALALILKDAGQAQIPPRLTVVLAESRAQGQTWVAEMEVRNTGDRTAAAVVVRAETADQTSEITVDHVAGRATAGATLILPVDPRTARFSIRGWSEP